MSNWLSTTTEPTNDFTYMTSVDLELKDMPATTATLPLDAFSMNSNLPYPIVYWAVASLLATHPTAAVEVVIVTPNSTTTYGFGAANGAGSAPPNGDSIFEIGSITKTFTGTLLAKAALDGLVDLDAAAQQHMPDGIVLPKSGDRAITMSDLATHSAGLVSFIASKTSDASGNGSSGQIYFPTFDQLRDAINGAVPVGTPGQYYLYSNLGTSLIGQALETVYGKSYATILRDEILDPLDMTDTSVYLTASPSLTYGYQGDKLSTWVDFNPPNDATNSSGAIRTTGNDMAKYISASLGLTKSPLSQAVDLASQPLFTVTEENLAPGTEGEHTGFSLGLLWEIRQIGGEEVISHDGSTFGFQSDMALARDSRVGVLVMYNNTDGYSSMVNNITNSLLFMQITMDKATGATLAA